MAMGFWKEAVVHRVIAANLRMAGLLLAGLPATGLLAVGCGDDAPGGGGASGAASGAGTGGSPSAGSTTGGSPSAGGTSAAAGSGQGGSSGDGPQGGSSAAGVAGDSSGGGAVAGEGGAAQAGSGGGDPGSIEYRACELLQAIDRIQVHRIDEGAGTCTLILLEESGLCNLGVEAGGWCLSGAQLSADVAACKMFMTPSDTKRASSAAGTISVSGSTVELDVTLDFPAGGGLPTSVSVAVSDCTADCMQNDCRP